MLLERKLRRVQKKQENLVKSRSHSPKRLSSGSKHILCIYLCLHRLMWTDSDER
jgi:hypothetical protein